MKHLRDVLPDFGILADRMKEGIFFCSVNAPLF